jgi:hypothetical protein
MRREDIDKAAVDSCVIENSIFNPELTPYYEQGFKDGANWRINSVWHEMCEKPDFSKLPILLQHKNGKIHFIDDIPSSWIYLQKYYTRWAYVKDLIPNMEE